MWALEVAGFLYRRVWRLLGQLIARRGSRRGEGRKEEEEAYLELSIARI
jgi:hypothetical protein